MKRPAFEAVARHAIFLSLSLVFASRFFSLRHSGSHAITEGDPATMCWTLQWVSHALVADPQYLLAGNTFYPYPHAVVLSDAMLSLAPVNVVVRAFTSNPWVGYNLLILLAYYLSAVAGFWLAEEITGSRLAGFWGGIFWAFLFFRVHHIGHLQILSFQGIPAAIVCLLRFLRAPGVRTSLAFSVVFVAQALVSWYLAVALATAVAIVAATRPLGEIAGRRQLQYAALIFVLCAIAILPVARAYAQAFDDSSLGERRALVDTFGDAVKPADFLTPPASSVLGSLVASNPYSIWGENTLYVGYVALALVVVSLIGADLLPAGSRRWLIAGVALMICGYVLALGFVSPSWGIRLPLHYAAKLAPFIAGMRATQRFALVIDIGVLVLSSLGLQLLLRRIGSPAGRGAVTAVVCSLFLVEVFPIDLPISAAHRYEVSAPDRAIAERQAARAEPLVVLHLPIYYFQEAYPVSEAVYMVDSTAHWARIVNGFSGGVPGGFMETMATLNRLPEAAAVEKLMAIGVDVVAVHATLARDRRATLAAYFRDQPWAAIVPLQEEFLVLIDRSRAPSALTNETSPGVH